MSTHASMAKIVDMHFELDLQVTSTVIYVLHEVAAVADVDSTCGAIWPHRF
jgi:hypothetical protein